MWMSIRPQAKTRHFRSNESLINVLYLFVFFRNKVYHEEEEVGAGENGEEK